MARAVARAVVSWVAVGNLRVKVVARAAVMSVVRAGVMAAAWVAV